MYFKVPISPNFLRPWRLNNPKHAGSSDFHHQTGRTLSFLWVHYWVASQCPTDGDVHLKVPVLSRVKSHFTRSLYDPESMIKRPCHSFATKVGGYLGLFANFHDCSEPRFSIDNDKHCTQSVVSGGASGFSHTRSKTALSFVS